MVAFNPEIDRAILLYNHISGPIYLLISLGVFALIWLDKDTRNTGYRRLMMGMQLFSISADLLLSSCAAVILTNQWALYAAGIAFGWSSVTLIQVLPPASKLRIRSNLQKFVIIMIEISHFIWLSLFANAFANMLLSDKDIPADIAWIKSRQCYGVFRYHHDSIFILGIFAAVTVPPFISVIVLMFAQIFHYLRVGMRHASEGTRRAQRRAAVTVLLLAIVPGCFLGIPFVGSYLLLLKRIPLLENVLNFATAFERPEVTAALFALANTHSIANSITIVGRSPRYRRVLLTPFVKAFGSPRMG